MLCANESGRLIARIGSSALTVYEAGRQLATIDVQIADGAQMGWVKDLLLLGDGVAEKLRVYNSRLEELAVLPGFTGCRLVATSGTIAAFITDDQRLAVFSMQRSLAFTRVGRIQGVTYACGDLDGICYLGRGERLERWDLTAYRLLAGFRLVLDFSPTNAGMNANGRQMWFTGRQSPLEVFRISDWMRQPQASAADAVRGCRASKFVGLRRGDDWLIVDLAGPRDGSRLERPVEDLCILPSSREPAFVMETRDGELIWTPPHATAEATVSLPSAAEPPPARPLAVPRTEGVATASVPLPAPETLPARAPEAELSVSRWRAQLFGGLGSRRHGDDSRAAAQAEAVVDQTLVETLRATPAPAPAPAARPQKETDWRRALVRWSPRASTTPPLGGRLLLLCQRLALGEIASRAVAYLYRRRLVGLGPPSPAQLIGVVPGQEGWREALGEGDLARLGVLDREQPELRPRLSQTARRFLDGSAPEFVQLEAGPADLPSIEEAKLVREHFAGRSPSDLAAAAAARTRSTLAWFHPPPDRTEDLSACALAARLNGAVALFVFDGPLRGRGLGTPCHPLLALVDRDSE